MVRTNTSKEEMKYANGGRNRGRTMIEILNVIQNASPALAAAIIGLLYAVHGQKKDIEELKKRVDDYDALKLSESLARIQTDLEWIKRKLEEE